MSNPLTPAIGDRHTINARAFEVTNIGNPVKHANTAAALAKRGLYPALCTLKCDSGRWKGTLYTALYNPATGTFQDLIKH